MQEKILVVGAADMNLTLPMRAIPPVGASVTEDGRPRYTAGGGAAVAAVALAGLGAGPSLAARVGGDVHGQRLSRLYRDTGIDTGYLRVDGRAPTGLRTVLSEMGGESRAVYYPGANRDISPSDVESAIIDTAPAALYLSLDIPHEPALGIARLAASYGLPLFVEAAGITPDFPLGALARAEIFCPDDKETYALTGTYPVGSDSCLKAAVELEKRVKARYYVIKLGERGLFLYDGRYCHMVPAYGIRMPENQPLCEALTAALTLSYLRSGGDVLAACRYALGYNALLLKNSADPTYFPEDREVREFAKTH